jgi:hypothetical protein
MLDAVMIALLFLSALCVLIVLADEIRTSVSGLRRRGVLEPHFIEEGAPRFSDPHQDRSTHGYGAISCVSVNLIM